MIKNKNKIFLIFFIAVFILLVFLYNKNEFIAKPKQETFKNNNNKGVLVLYGESFREGTQGSRLRDTEFSYDPQKQASKSHIDFCDFLKYNYSIDMDIIIQTYDTKYEKQHKSWYNKYNLQYISHRNLQGNNVLAQKACDMIDKSKYKFVVFTRNDLLLKSKFFDIFNPNWTNIRYISNNWTKWQSCGFYENNIPVVNPMIKFIPNNYFFVLNNIHIDHESYKHYIKNFNLTPDDIDYMVDDYHDADSYKDYNPYYKLAGRPETNIWHDAGKKFNKSNILSNKQIIC